MTCHMIVLHGKSTHLKIKNEILMKKINKFVCKLICGLLLILGALGGLARLLDVMILLTVILLLIGGQKLLRDIVWAD